MVEDLVEQIKEWAATRSDEIVFVPTNGYYSFDIVVDAYMKGRGDGHESGREEGGNYLKEEMRKKYYNNAKLTAEALSIMIVSLKEKGYSPTKLFINNSINSSSVLFSMPNEVHINDDFLTLGYNEASSLKLKFHDKGLNIKIGFLSDSEILDTSLIKADGYGLAFNLIDNTVIE